MSVEEWGELATIRFHGGKPFRRIHSASASSASVAVVSPAPDRELEAARSAALAIALTRQFVY